MREDERLCKDHLADSQATYHIPAHTNLAFAPSPLALDIASIASHAPLKLMVCCGSVIRFESIELNQVPHRRQFHSCHDSSSFWRWLVDETNCSTCKGWRDTSADKSCFCEAGHWHITGKLKARALLRALQSSSMFSAVLRVVCLTPDLISRLPWEQIMVQSVNHTVILAILLDIIL